MDFRKGMRNCLITGNTFLSDAGYWVRSESTVSSWLKAGGNTQSCVISNNVFKNTDGGFMSFKNLTGTAIVGNAMQNKTEKTVSTITISGTNKNNAIANNAVA